MTSQSDVIVVDKDRHACALISDFLAEAQCVSVSVADGYTALDRARKAPPALVITEVLVPSLDGLALCRLIKSDGALRGTKVMVLSMLSAEERALKSGADAFMMKPIEKESFVATVRALIAAPHEETE